MEISQTRIQSFDTDRHSSNSRPLMHVHSSNLHENIEHSRRDHESTRRQSYMGSTRQVGQRLSLSVTQERQIADSLRSHDQTNNHHFHGVSSARTRTSERSHGANEYYYEEDADNERYTVPALPMSLAVLCCILNFILPGFGSMLAAMCVMCCAITDDMTSKEKCGSCCTVFLIGILQLLLTACFLIGWVWSCIWGITFIVMSDSNSLEMNSDEEYYVTSNSHSHRHNRERTPVPQPQIVVNQPYPGGRYENIYTERERRRREVRHTRSRISITPSNLIYPMRAPSNIVYNSPPPPYRETATPVTSVHFNAETVTRSSGH